MVLRAPILKRFEKTLGVATHQGRRPRPPANQVFDAAHDLFLLEQARLYPSALSERYKYKMDEIYRQN